MAEMQYAIDLAKNIIFCKFKGFLRPKALIAHIMEIRNDPVFHHNLNTIADLRDAILPVSFLEMNDVADFVKATSSIRGKFKLALITNQSSTNRGAGIYTALSDCDHAKLCADMEEAEAWVGGWSIPRAKLSRYDLSMFALS